MAENKWIEAMNDQIIFTLEKTYLRTHVNSPTDARLLEYFPFSLTVYLLKW
jgi:hypothetical protein